MLHNLNRFKLFGLFFFVLIASGCPQVWSKEDTPPSTPPDAQTIKNVEVPFLHPNVNLAASKAELILFDNEIKTLMKARDFEGLENMAVKFRDGKERFIGGGWKIHSFYSSVSAPISPKITESAWKTHIDFLQAWKQAIPESVTARCALVNAYISYAWLPRGHGFANSVSDAAWKVFYERLEMATAEAKSIANPQEDPYGYFENKLVLAKAQGWDRQWFESTFTEAISLDPTYQYFYTQKAVYLLPRWSGAPGEWERFADETKNRIGGQEGLKLYYLIAAEISTYFGSGFFEQNRVSWTNLKKGFLIMEAQYGMTVYRLNQFGAIAFDARDTQATCKTFALLTSDDYDSEIWKDKAGFENRRKIAQMMCMMPRADNMVKEPSPFPTATPPKLRSNDFL